MLVCSEPVSDKTPHVSPGEVLQPEVWAVGKSVKKNVPFSAGDTQLDILASKSSPFEEFFDHLSLLMIVTFELI